MVTLNYPLMCGSALGLVSAVVLLLFKLVFGSGLVTPAKPFVDAESDLEAV